MSLRILVTGASGFVGSALVPALAAAGHYVRGASRNPTDVVAGERIESVRLTDLARVVDWDPLIAGIDTVIHLAAIAHRQQGDTIEYDEINRGAVARLAQASLQHGVQRLIFLSSIGAQTGSAADHIVTEQDEPHPVTGYDRAKLAAEEGIRQSGIPHSILRPVIVYGPNAKANIALMLRIAATPWPLPFGAFQNRRSLLAIANLVQAVIACLNSSATLNETFIVADPEPVSLAEMFVILREAHARRPGLVPIPPSVIRGVLKLAGREMLWDRIGRDLVVSTAKLQKTGWKPFVRTEDGLRAIAIGASRTA